MRNQFLKRAAALLLPVISFFYSQGQVNKIEHFYVSSYLAKTLFHTFKDDFDLPVIWDYASNGDYASGGLWAGNVVLEFSDHPPIDKTRFKGIGLEPTGTANAIDPLLTAAGIRHDSIDSYVGDSAKKDTLYSIIMFQYLLPNVKMFICEYKYKQEYDKYKDKMADTLSFMQADKLGMIGVKEIVMGCKDLYGCAAELRKIPGIKIRGSDLFEFNAGPGIRLTEADSTGITKIVVSVKSVEMAKIYLQSKGLLSHQYTNAIVVDPRVVDGLVIEMTDK